MAFGTSLLSRGNNNQTTHTVVNNHTTNQPNLFNSSSWDLCPNFRIIRRPLGHNLPWWKSWTKKYVILCSICGGIAVSLGIIFIAIYFTLRSYTSSLQYFETVPTYVPAVVLIITGLLVICFAKRRNRYAYLIKLAGGCCLICALLCVVITVTTTVIHMNRLQTLRECVYTQRAKTCTCFVADSNTEEGSSRYVFSNTPDCEVVHGSLYSCLRALFGLSVMGILVCIFSSMLVCQLLSHEKKKMYWEQLELRRRFFHRHGYCDCCDDCGYSSPQDMYAWQSWYWPSNTSSTYSAVPDDPQSSVLVGNTSHQASGWNWLPLHWNNSNHQMPNQQQSQGASNAVSQDVGRTQESTLTTNISSPPPPPPALPPYQNDNFPLVVRPPLYRGGEHRFGVRRGNAHFFNRRRRSNDAVFHHLNMNIPRYHPAFSGDSGYLPPFMSYAGFDSFPRYMWGPPPPYSHPPSTESVANETNENQVQELIVNDSLASADSQRELRSVRLAESLETSLFNEEPVAEVASKPSSPGDFRRLHAEFCNRIILFNEGNNSFSSDCMPVDDGKLPDSCIVEVHSIIRERNKIIDKLVGSNTLPTRSNRRLTLELNPIKSTSNIPESFTWHCPNANVSPNDFEQNAILQCFSGLRMILGDSIQDVHSHSPSMSPSPTRKDSEASKTYNITDSEPSIYNSTVTGDSYTSPATDNAPSFLSFDPIDLDHSSFYRSSIAVSTTPSTPIADNAFPAEMLYARSLPNIPISMLSNSDSDLSDEDGSVTVTPTESEYITHFNELGDDFEITEIASHSVTGERGNSVRSERVDLDCSILSHFPHSANPILPVIIERKTSAAALAEASSALYQSGGARLRPSLALSKLGKSDSRSSEDEEISLSYIQQLQTSKNLNVTSLSTKDGVVLTVKTINV